MKKKSILSLLLSFWNHLSKKRHRQFYILIVLILLSSFAELISIGAVVPFLAILIEPNQVNNFPKLLYYINIFGFSDVKGILLFISVIFIIATILAGSIRLLFIWVSTKFAHATGSDLSLEIYRRTLYQPYKVHVSRNSSEVISGITIKANSMSSAVLSPVLDILGSLIVIGSIISFLISMEPIISIVSIGGFGLIYVAITFLFRKRLARTSKAVSIESTRILKSLQEGLGGIRDVLINGSQEIYCQDYAEADRNVRRAQAESAFTGYSPKVIIESLGIVFIVCFSYIISTSMQTNYSTIPLIGSLAFSAQKILPLMQQAYQAWARILSAEWVLVDVLELLDQPLPESMKAGNYIPISFQKEILLSELNFRYAETGPYTLKKINLSISKGKRIGFIGKTGSGKSTLIDLIMGLLEPSSGKLLVDGSEVNANNLRNWQVRIAHVPQSIFLSDTSIAENIAFGISQDKINFERVKLAAKQAQLLDHIESLPERFNTKVGERGIRLSGGQRQRIGIARALYKNASVIVFDEATSALDNETEKAVMDAIDGLDEDLTIIMIAHRISTIKNCDQIIELKNGEISRIGNYSELFTTTT